MSCPTFRSWFLIPDEDDGESFDMTPELAALLAEDPEAMEEEDDATTWGAADRWGVESLDVDPLFRKPVYLGEEAAKKARRKRGSQDGIERLREVVGYMIAVKPFNRRPC